MDINNHKIKILTLDDYDKIAALFINFIINIPFDNMLFNYYKALLGIKIRMSDITNNNNIFSHSKLKILKDKIKEALIPLDIKAVELKELGFYYGQLMFRDKHFYCHGFGVMRYKIGCSFLGNWSKNIRNGYGAIFYTCGYAWSGEWNDNVKKWNKDKSTWIFKRKMELSNGMKCKGAIIGKCYDESKRVKFIEYPILKPNK